MATMTSGSTGTQTFFADVTDSRTAREGFDALVREWLTQVGEAWPLAGLDIDRSTAFRISLRSVKVHDTWISDFHSASYVGRTTAEHAADDNVLIHLMRRGLWRFASPDGQDADVAVPAGSFVVRDDGPPCLFDVAAGSMADVLVLPASAVRPYLRGGGPALGSASAAEARVLMAHARTVGETAADLTPVGLRAARDALLELAKGVLRGQFDDAEPLFAPALARAAMKFADAHLTDPGLTPAALARQLNVSVRTLHRAFAAAGEPVAAYIRRRRLEQALIELTPPLYEPARRPGVSEVAARYQFADGSHFIRAFKARYGQTPAEFARTVNQ
jgi:AraC family transcriptional regulator, positive regulator of tynA and feaB